MKRHKLGGGYSKKMFSRNASGAHKKNFSSAVANPMRGGIRL